MMINLVSEEGTKISASYEGLQSSTVLRDMIDNLSKVDSIPVPKVNENTLRKIVDWGMFHASHDHTEPFDRQFFDDMNEDSLLQLLLATFYLDMQELTDLGANRLAKLLEDKSDEEIMQIFNVDRVHFKKRCSCCGCLQTDEDGSSCCASVITEDALGSTTEDDGPAADSAVSL